MHDLVHTWARDYAVPPLAIADLFRRMGVGMDTLPSHDIPEGASETAVSQRVRVALTRAGVINWRNNSGAVKNPEGQMVRFGLCNDTEALNKKFKSPDLVGINNAVITQDMVGLPRGQFVGREVKKEGWVYTGTEREVAQLAFGQIIIANGGDFAFTTGSV